MKAGPGSQYVQTFRDKAGNRFDGGKSYRLHVPANVSAAVFWSLTVYDTATRSMIQNPSNDSAGSMTNSRPTRKVPLTFTSAQSPRGPGSQLDRTVGGKGFYPMMRFYTPKAGLFDGTWKLPDIELVK